MGTWQRGTRLHHLLLGLLLSVWSAVALAALFGPGKFEIVQADSRFSESGNPMWTSRNNRISKKSIVGGTHLDAMGVYVNPTATKDKQSGEVVALGLIILNHASFDTNYGSPNSLGIIQEIAFALGDSPPIVLPVTGGDYVWSETTSYNSVSKSASKDIAESGMAPLTLDQYTAIAAADSLAVRIVGSKRSVTYESKDLTKEFLPNLRAFLDQVVQ